MCSSLEHGRSSARGATALSLLVYPKQPLQTRLFLRKRCTSPNPNGGLFPPGFHSERLLVEILRGKNGVTSKGELSRKLKLSGIECSPGCSKIGVCRTRDAVFVVLRYCSNEVRGAVHGIDLINICAVEEIESIHHELKLDRVIGNGKCAREPRVPDAETVAEIRIARRRSHPIGYGIAWDIMG